MSWNDEKVQELKKLWGTGLSASQIAAQLGGVTRNAVISKIHRLGLAERGARRGESSRQQRRTRPRPPAPKAPVAGRKSFVADVWAMFGDKGPEPAPKEDDPADFPNRVVLRDLTEKSCRWPIGDPQHENFGFCGKDKTMGLPYCEAHARRAYQPPNQQRRMKRKDKHEVLKARKHDGEEVVS